LRGFRLPVGWWLTGFLGFMLLATPFSVYRGGTVAMLENFIPRSYMLLFFVASLTTSIRKCRQLMYVNVVVSLMLLLTCMKFGAYAQDGRLYLPGGAGFFGNSNELALQLLMGITQFVFLFSQGGAIGKMIAALGITCTVPYMLWTGSRGCALAAIALGILLLCLSRNRIRGIAILVLIATVGFIVAPSAILRRLTILTVDETSSADLSAVESQESRIKMIQKSISETWQHPLFGVGPGMFQVAMMEEAKAENKWIQVLGTHNAYTQVSSECGIPAFICYIAAIISTFMINIRLWKRFRNRPDGADITRLSVALWSGCLVFAICAMFFHMAYTPVFPLLAGQSVALHLAAMRKLEEA
jgi:hypothetical protein